MGNLSDSSYSKTWLVNGWCMQLNIEGTCLCKKPDSRGYPVVRALLCFVFWRQETTNKEL